MEKEMEKLIVEEICKKYGKSENFIILLTKICKDNNILDIKNTIEKILA